LSSGRARAILVLEQQPQPAFDRVADQTDAEPQVREIALQFVREKTVRLKAEPLPVEKTGQRFRVVEAVASWSAPSAEGVVPYLAQRPAQRRARSMKLVERGTRIGSGRAASWVREVRKLTY
jgi:hypothetical protein